ncbi:hypothetical protein JL721_9940 [Aureococcus anophagefferens]|nr:hypothetical protein JL721_9940 [Aureococcus anophagefferens]
MLSAFSRGADRVASVKHACQAAGVVMGNELAKRYAIEPDATGSGGHGYSWKSYSATRKKDGLEVSVFGFDKSALEKKLRGQGKDLVRQIVEVMRRDVEVMAEYSGVDPKALEKARAPAASGGASLRDAMMSGVTGVAVATATKRAPLGCLQLIETLESRTAAVFVGERVARSLGNAVHNLWPNVDAAHVPRDWLSADLSEAEVSRGGASLCDALMAMRGVGGLPPRCHLGVSPENVWLTKTGDWRLGGFGLSLPLPPGQYGVPSPYFGGAAGADGYQAGDGAELALLTGGPRLSYCAPELTAEGQRIVSCAADVFSLGCVLWEAYGKRGMGSRGQRSAPLLDGCGDSLYRHRSMVATKLAQNLDVALLPPLARDAVGRALAPGPAGRPDAAALRGCPAFHSTPVMALKELDGLASRDPTGAMSFLGSLAPMLAEDAPPEMAACFDDRALKVVVVVPNLDAATRARPQLCAHASAAVLACAKRLDAADFRTTLQPLLERFLGDEKTPPAALHAVVSHAGLLLERADAAWAATRVTDALCRALREASGAALVDAALAQLGDGDTLDALVAKSSLAGPGGACGKLSGELVPAVCRVAVAATSPLGCKVRAHKALAACLERPAATPPDVVSGVCVPALHASVKKVDGHPALAMCVLGCYDVVAKRLPERSRITRDVLPALVPLLDEKTLNAKQFEMVVVRVEQMLAAAVKARRTELSVGGAAPRGGRAAVPALAATRSPTGTRPRPRGTRPRPPRRGTRPRPRRRRGPTAPPTLRAPRRRAARCRAPAPLRRQLARPEPAAAAGRDVDAAGAAAQLDANAAEIARLKQQLASASVGGGVADQIATARSEIQSLQSQLSQPADPFGGAGMGGGGMGGGFQQPQPDPSA